MENFLGTVRFGNNDFAVIARYGDVVIGSMTIKKVYYNATTNCVVERRNRTLVEAARTMLTFANLPSFLWVEAITTACFRKNRSIIHKRFDKTSYELINKRKPNIKFFRVFGCRCYLLNDYEDVGKLKSKGNIRVFVGYSKESVAFKIYNKRTLSKVDEASKNDLEDLFQNFYDEYFDSSEIMKSSTTNVETPINEEVFHESFYQPYPHKKKWTKDHLLHKIIGDLKSSIQKRGQLAISCLFSFLLSFIEPANVAEALKDADWNKEDESSLVIRNKEKLIEVSYSQQQGIDYDETFVPVTRIAATRLFLAYVAHKDFTIFQMDVKTVFLNGILKEEV
uniref:Retrovirus-related Pol polyprotein from transposon TNT 1-94 n=1 Tax=Tanacetum cinerariifolium TaxID=118510 RepID=A0A6L2JDV1_TANCI|nr:retrovirus-related Pol polyprotein from transposon TNT 1-94 [Tanacetum cinerariifolium]